MPGRAIVTIGSKEWEVSLATTPWELAQGLGSIPAIPPGTGMLFDLGAEQIIQVTTVPMLFSLDIAFLSSSLVVTEIARDVPPGYLVTSEHPARFFLEVNAGELEGVEAGDTAAVEFLPFEVSPAPAIPAWAQSMFAFMGFMVMTVFLVSMVRSFTRGMLESPKRPRLLPKTVKEGGEALASEILAGLKGRGPQYRAYVRFPRDKSAFVTLGSIVGGHYSWNPQGFTVWVDAWQRDTQYPPDSVLAIRELRKGHSFEATEEGVKKALDYMASEFPTFTRSQWVSSSIPVHVAKEVSILSEKASGGHPPKARSRRLTRDDVRVEVWEERGRLHIGIQDRKTGEYVASWWDDEAREMFEQGFFKRGKDLKESVLGYAEEVGLLAPQGQYSPGTQGSARVLRFLAPESRRWARVNSELYEKLGVRYDPFAFQMTVPESAWPAVARDLEGFGLREGEDYIQLSEAVGAEKGAAELRKKWHERGVEAGKTDAWMDVESTMAQTQERRQLKDPHELVWTDIEEWETTDHFSILYGSKMMEDSARDYDLYSDLKSGFWEGYLEGRKQAGIDIYRIASGLVSSPHHSNPGETILIPFSEAPAWVREEWAALHGRTRPRVRVYRTPVAEIPPPVFDYAVRDIVAHKDGRTMRAYVPSYESLLAATPEQKALYFGGAVKLAPDEAIAVMDYWGGRYQNIDLYVHPQAYEPPRVIGPTLTERQRKILATIRAYIPSYRREVFKAHNVTEEELDELRGLGLIDRRGAITVMGRNVVGKESPWGMYESQTALIGPTGRQEKPAPGELRYFADSPDDIRQSMDRLGLTGEVRRAFREALVRAITEKFIP